MKIKLASICAIAFTISIMAQPVSKTETFEKPIKKGVYQIGGFVSGTYAKGKYYNYFSNSSLYTTSYSKSFSFYLLLRVGKFVSDGLMLGISPSVMYGRSTFESINTSKSESTSVGLGLYTNYYLSNGILFNTEVGATKYPGGYSYIYLIGGVGYAYFVNRHISIESILNYKYSANRKDVVDSKYHSVLLSVGLKYFFGKNYK